MRTIITLLSMLLLAACGQPKRLDALGVRDAWVRLPAVSGNPGAAYFTIQGGPQPNLLIGASSPRISRIELHESMMMDGHDGMAGMATMKPLASVTVPPEKQVAFKPGGNHAMLFGIDPAVKAGSDISLTFRFASGAQMTLDAKVVGPTDPDPVKG